MESVVVHVIVVLGVALSAVCPKNMICATHVVTKRTERRKLSHKEL